MEEEMLQPLENEAQNGNQAHEIEEDVSVDEHDDLMKPTMEVPSGEIGSDEVSENSSIDELIEDDSTKFNEVYELFLSQIDDYEIASIDTENELTLYIEKYLLNCLPSIQDAINSLDDIDLEKKSFGFKLTFVEKALVAKAMKLEWVREKKFSLDLMRKSIGDRDFKAVQGTDYLRRLSAMEQQLRYELRDEIIQHSYSRDDYWSVFRR